MVTHTVSVNSVAVARPVSQSSAATEQGTFSAKVAEAAHAAEVRPDFQDARIEIDRAVQKPGPPAEINLSSGLTTYRDHESGRLIIRVFDREGGDVLYEFPPEQAVTAFKPLTPVEGGPPKNDITV